MAPPLSVSKSWQAPFFGKSSAYAGGRDPIGLQATSVATYTRLLPGITNVTNRIRYWSFYCWLVQLYSKKIHRTGRRRFVDFVRRGEFTLAVAIEVAASEERSVSGKDKARRAAQHLPLDLSKFADSSVRSGNRYWKNESGAFGQYYAGVLTDLGLLEKNEYGIYVCTDKDLHEKFAINLEVSGTELAAAFREAIGAETESRFFAAIENGVVSEAELQFFGERMTLSNIQPNSAEWNLMQKVLTGNDLPGRRLKALDSFFRLGTIQLLLQFRQLHPERDIHDLPFWLEEREGLGPDGHPSEVAFGWFYYAVNEHWHIANELIFKAFLDRLHQFDFSRMASFIKEFTEEITRQAMAISQSTEGITAQQWQVLAKDKESANEEAGCCVTEAVQGFEAVLDLHAKYQARLDSFILFGQRLGIERSGDFGHGLRLVGEHLHRPLDEFVEWYLMRQVVNRHLFVAMDKLASSGVNTQKFKLEDGILYFIKNISVGNTNPRLQQLGLFLRDLKILDEKYLPTELATHFLEPQKSTHR